MNLIVDINIFRFFISWNLPSPYKNKLIRLLSITVEEKVFKVIHEGGTGWTTEMQERNQDFLRAKVRFLKKSIARCNLDPS